MKWKDINNYTDISHDNYYITGYIGEVKIIVSNTACYKHYPWYRFKTSEISHYEYTFVAKKDGVLVSLVENSSDPEIEFLRDSLYRKAVDRKKSLCLAKDELEKKKKKEILEKLT